MFYILFCNPLRVYLDGFTHDLTDSPVGLNEIVQKLNDKYME